jgi:hypothetical protein
MRTAAQYVSQSSDLAHHNDLRTCARRASAAVTRAIHAKSNHTGRIQRSAESNAQPPMFEGGIGVSNSDAVSEVNRPSRLPASSCIRCYPECVDAARVSSRRPRGGKEVKSVAALCFLKIIDAQQGRRALPARALHGRRAQW